MTAEKNVTLQANLKGCLNLNSSAQYSYTLKQQEERSFAKGTQDLENMEE